MTPVTPGDFDDIERRHEQSGIGAVPGIDRRRQHVATPTVGRIVHVYGTTNTEPWAAIIARVHTAPADVAAAALVDVFVFAPGAGAAYPMVAVPYAETDDDRPEGFWTRWTWPPRA